ncbi:MAG: hypothetical protein HND52_14705 [Ignavibacteriae bacterium]|nr:hypothetical protein [Ignavibacteriota bacterium]NOG99204.1 hypothetical protein [Ignavibacteriota bacterium]
MKKLKIIMLLFTATILFSSCATTYTNRDPVGKYFPSVSGQTLTEEDVELPKFFSGSEVILLIAYKQDTQFDVDRWLIGLDMTNTKAKVYELPTIQGLFPRMFKTFIDEGMRSGIPKEFWGGVITIYSGGAEVQKFTGNENPNNTRVILLDKDGKVIFFHDRGFSVQSLNELRSLLTEDN